MIPKFFWTSWLGMLDTWMKFRFSLMLFVISILLCLSLVFIGFNSIAHVLASHARRFRHLVVWLERPPSIGRFYQIHSNPCFLQALLIPCVVHTRKINFFKKGKVNNIRIFVIISEMDQPRQKIRNPQQ